MHAGWKASVGTHLGNHIHNDMIVCKACPGVEPASHVRCRSGVGAASASLCPSTRLHPARLPSRLYARGCRPESYAQRPRRGLVPLGISLGVVHCHRRARDLDRLCEAVNASLPALSAKKRDFMERYTRGETIVAIARTMGMSRPHPSCVYRPVVSAMVAIARRATIKRISTAAPGAANSTRPISPGVGASRHDRGIARVAELRP